MPKSILSQISTWVLRILIVVFVLSMLLVFFTANLGGRGETQRQSLQAMMMQILGYQVDIQRLGYYQVFPTFTIDAADIVLSSGDMEPDIIIGSIFLQEDVWRRPFSSKTIRAFVVNGLVTRPGLFGPASLHVQNAQQNVSSPSSEIIINGSYDLFPINAAIPFHFQSGEQGNIQIGPFKSNIKYDRSRHLFSLSDVLWGKIKATGTLHPIPAGGYTLTLDGITGCDPYVFAQIDYKRTDNGDYVFPIRMKDVDGNEKKGHAEWKTGHIPHLVMSDKNDTGKIISCIK